MMADQCFEEKQTTVELVEEEERKREREELLVKVHKKIEEGWLENPEAMKMMDAWKPWLQQPTIKEGETYDLTQLLSSSSSPTRDYLIKCIGSKYYKVPIDELHGKYVIIYVWVLSDQHTPDTAFTADLADIYSSASALEVVFVALGDNKEAFDKSSSPMPWLAIPHEDHQARQVFLEKFGLPYRPSFLQAFFFDPLGTVLHTDIRSCIATYGPICFPFTENRIQRVCDESRALWENLVLKKQKTSLTTLLGPYVISNEGRKVLTSELEDKTVGLFFCDLDPCGFRRTRELLEMWKALGKYKKCVDFQIVFINTNRYARRFFARGNFKKKFACTNPWYTLPYDGRILSLVFKVGRDECVPDAGYFVVLKPDKYELISYFAFDIFRKFGIDAFPFTLQRAVTIAMRRARCKLPGNLSSSSACPYVKANMGEEEVRKTLMNFFKWDLRRL